MRVSIQAIPQETTVCPIKRSCVYRTWTRTSHPRPICDDPRTNKGNSDAACHKMLNKNLLAILQAPK